MCEYQIGKNKMHRHTMMLVIENDGHNVYGWILGNNSMAMDFEFMECWSYLWSTHQVYLILDLVETLMKKS